MGKAIDLTGQRFGFWMVLQRAEKNKSGQTQWLCQCECGKQKTVSTNSLRTGNSTSCGCNHAPDLSGQQFNKLKVVRVDKDRKTDRKHWLCECECGKQISVNTYKLRNNVIVSCGDCDGAMARKEIPASSTEPTPIINKPIVHWLPVMVSYDEFISIMKETCEAVRYLKNWLALSKFEIGLQ
jgi:hypothetical protein